MTKKTKDQPTVIREPKSEVDFAKQREDYKKQKEADKNKKSPKETK